jgi:type I restriction enzyme S subunit
MKQGWEIKKLGDVIADIKDGGTPSRKHPEYFGGSVKWCVVKDIKPLIYETKESLTKEGLGKCSAKLWPIDTIIISLGATIGNVGLAKVPVATKQGLSGIVVKKENLLPEYLIYFLQYKKDFIQNIATGTTIKEVRPPKLKERLEVPIPPFDEQKRIVVKLDECFEAIHKARTNVEKNLNNAKELFQSQLNQIFSQKSDGWVEKKLGEVCDLSRGHNPPKKDFIYEPKEDYVRFYQIRDGWSDKYKVYVPNTTKLHRVDENEILMVAYRHIGRRFRGAVGAFNVALCKITNKDKGLLEDDYLYHIIPTDYVRGELLKRSERSLIPSMSVKHLMNIEIPLPPIEEQKKIVIKITKLHIQTQSLESNYQQELDALDELKKSILQKAFNGEL